METVVFWHWFALGGLLLIVELLAPGMFFLWMAEAAGVTGVVLWLWPWLSLEYQVGLFSVVSVVSILLVRRFLLGRGTGGDNHGLNQRTAHFVGNVFVVEEEIRNGEGRVRIGDSVWKVRGEDAKAGSRVKVIGTDGIVLEVESCGGEKADSL